MLEKLDAIDTRLFLFLNGLHNEVFDGIMVWVSGKTTWWPFYLILLIWLAWKTRWKMVPVFLFIVLAVTLADQISVHLFKEVFERLRPCQEPDLEGMVHLVNGKCGGRYGFVSSHAANTFAVAMFLLLVMQKRWFTGVMIFWATLVGYSRIYLGVHYPGDVIAGAMLGVLIGYLLWIIFRWLLPRLPDSWQMSGTEKAATG